MKGIKLIYCGVDLEEPRIKEYDVLVDGNAVAYIMFFITSDGQAMVYNLFVEKEHRGKGIGSRIIKSLGAEVTALDVLVKSRGFWENLGATVIMHRHDKV